MLIAILKSMHATVRTMAARPIDLEDKALYAAKAMSLARELARVLTDDDQRRIIGRFALVYLDAFVLIAQRLKNRLPACSIASSLATQAVSRRPSEERRVRLSSPQVNAMSGGQALK